MIFLSYNSEPPARMVNYICNVLDSGRLKKCLKSRLGSDYNKQNICILASLTPRDSEIRRWSFELKAFLGKSYEIKPYSCEAVVYDSSLSKEELESLIEKQKKYFLDLVLYTEELRGALSDISALIEVILHQAKELTSVFNVDLNAVKAKLSEIFDIRKLIEQLATKSQAVISDEVLFENLKVSDFLDEVEFDYLEVNRSRFDKLYLQLKNPNSDY